MPSPPHRQRPQALLTPSTIVAIDVIIKYLIEWHAKAQTENLLLNKFLESLDLRRSSIRARNGRSTVLAYDSVKIMTSIYANDNLRLKIINLKGETADKFVAMLQGTLDILRDFSGVQKDYDKAWNRAFKLMKRLVQESDIVVPSFMKLDLGDVVLLNQSQPVSGGGYGNIYKGHTSEHGFVVLKAPRNSSNRKQMKIFARECIQWFQWKHEGILPLLGMFQKDEGQWAAVSPCKKYGCVTDYLKEYPNVNRLKKLLQISHPVQYLHTLKVTHGDLKPNNILVDESGSPYLCDFGFSCIDHQLSKSRSEPIIGGTYHFMAPENLLYDKRLSLTTDIWSFAGVVLEVLSGKHPYYRCTSDAQLLRAINMRESPIPRNENSVVLQLSESNLRPDVMALLRDCFSFDPTKRPTIDKIVGILEKLSVRNGKTSAQQVQRTIGIEGKDQRERILRSFEERLKDLRITYTLSSPDPIKLSETYKMILCGNSINVDEAVRDIEEFSHKLHESGESKVKLPKEHFGYLIGSHGRLVKALTKKHGVEIQFERENSQALVIGGRCGRESAKAELEEISACLAERNKANLANRVEKRVRSTPRPRKHAVQKPRRASSAPTTPTLKTPPVARSFSLPGPAQIKAPSPASGSATTQPKQIERSIGGEGFGPILPIFKFSTHEWQKIISHCGGPDNPRFVRETVLIMTKKGICKLRGEERFVTRLYKELQRMSNEWIVDEKYVSKWRHRGLVDFFRARSEVPKQTGAHIYFPSMPEYRHCSQASSRQNTDQDLLFLVGKMEECAAARDLLSKWKTIQDENTRDVAVPRIHHEFLLNECQARRRLRKECNAILELLESKNSIAPTSPALSSSNSVSTMSSLESQPYQFHSGQPWERDGVARRRRYLRKTAETKEPSSPGERINWRITVDKIENFDRYLALVREMITIADNCSWIYVIKPLPPYRSISVRREEIMKIQLETETFIKRTNNRCWEINANHSV